MCVDGDRKVVDGRVCVCVDGEWVCGPVYEPDAEPDEVGN